jgi:glycerol-3-phosphate dehydrogenase (NAD(P)+)
MAGITVLGAGAFGTALAISLAKRHGDIILWARKDAYALQMAADRMNAARLANCPFPDALAVTSSLSAACASSVLLLAIPMQQIAVFVREHSAFLQGKTLVCCCKGVDLQTYQGPVGLVKDLLQNTQIAILSGPSFAVDIAQGLPTALTIAGENIGHAQELQSLLTTQNLRLYANADPIGVEFGGALKNVMAIACGIAIGAGLGESARAALMTRGFSEMQRLAVHLGASAETLSGLSGFGDLVLTCTSEKSRNYSHGLKLGRGVEIDPAVTVEGVATAQAVALLAQKLGIDMPITCAVSDILTSSITISEAIEVLLSRPLTKE